MATEIGLNVPQWRLGSVARQPILMLRRFDRAEDGSRVPFISAMSAIDGKDHGEQRSYLELADSLRQDGGAPEQDLHELWRRIVFYMLISNTDDHLRNHAFLRSAKGWRLSPLCDANPCPVDVKPLIFLNSKHDHNRPPVLLDDDRLQTRKIDKASKPVFGVLRRHAAHR